jgi:hypothetical protein
MIDDAASRRSSSSSRRVRSTASLVAAANFSTASASEVASISKASGRSPAAVSSCVSPTYSTGRVGSAEPSTRTGIMTRIVPTFRSVKTSSR